MFVDPNNNRKMSFPAIKESSSVYLSVIVPAYNEEERMPIMLKETLEHLEKRQVRSVQ
jgi:dolichyl-phosphate beta-glucosyltransferase